MNDRSTPVEQVKEIKEVKIKEEITHPVSYTQKDPEISSEESKLLESCNALSSEHRLTQKNQVTDKMIDWLLEKYPYKAKPGNHSANRKEVKNAIILVASRENNSLKDAVIWLGKKVDEFSKSDAGQRGTKYTPRASTWFRDRCYDQNSESWEFTDPGNSAGEHLMTWEEAYGKGYKRSELEIVPRVKDELNRPKVRPREGVA